MLAAGGVNPYRWSAKYEHAKDDPEWRAKNADVRAALARGGKLPGEVPYRAPSAPNNNRADAEEIARRAMNQRIANAWRR